VKSNLLIQKGWIDIYRIRPYLCCMKTNLKTKDIAALAIIALFVGGLIGISWWALAGITLIGVTGITFEFVSTVIREENRHKTSGTLEKIQNFF
jgi:xanthine/uracil permease